MSSVEFDSDPLDIGIPRTNQPKTSFITKKMIDLSLAKDEEHAGYILLIVSFILISIAIALPLYYFQTTKQPSATEMEAAIQKMKLQKIPSANNQSNLDYYE